MDLVFEKEYIVYHDTCLCDFILHEVLVSAFNRIGTVILPS
jgi:hypothetical protein